MTVAQAIESKVRDALPVAHLQLDGAGRELAAFWPQEAHLR